MLRQRGPWVDNLFGPTVFVSYGHDKKLHMIGSYVEVHYVGPTPTASFYLYIAYRSNAKDPL